MHTIEGHMPCSQALLTYYLTLRQLEEKNFVDNRPPLKTDTYGSFENDNCLECDDNDVEINFLFHQRLDDLHGPWLLFEHLLSESYRLRTAILSLFTSKNGQEANPVVCLSSVYCIWRHTPIRVYIINPPNCSLISVKVLICYK